MTNIKHQTLTDIAPLVASSTLFYFWNIFDKSNKSKLSSKNYKNIWKSCEFEGESFCPINKNAFFSLKWSKRCKSMGIGYSHKWEAFISIKFRTWNAYIQRDYKSFWSFFQLSCTNSFKQKVSNHTLYEITSSPLINLTRCDGI